MPGVTGYLNIIETKLRNSNYNYLKGFYLRRFLIILTSSSLFIAISGSLKTYFSFSLYGTSQSYQLLLATFLVIYSVYGLNKITDNEEDQVNAPERSLIIRGHENLFKYTTGISFILSMIIGLFYGWKVLLILLFPLIAGLIYSIKIHDSIPRLKDIFAAKSLIVALSWTIGNTFLPIVDSNVNLILVTIIFSFFFIKSFINTVLFDLMDVEGDKKIGTITIPVVIGPLQTVKLLLVANSLLIILLYISIDYGVFLKLILPLIFCIIYGYVYIMYFYQKKNRFQLEILVDGEWILIFLIIIMMHGFNYVF